MAKIPWNKGKKMSPIHKKNWEVSIKLAREKKKHELIQRVCYNDSIHVPYRRDNGNPTWFRHPKVDGAYLCGLCYYHAIKSLKFSSTNDLLQWRADFMHRKNPMFKSEVRDKISRRQSGENNSFFQKKHTSAFIEKLSTKWTGDGNPNYRGRLLYKIRKEKTIPQLMLEIIVEELGVPFQADVAGLRGTPDVKTNNILLFCDGDYHHANPNEFLDARGKVKRGYPPNHAIYKNPVVFSEDIWKYDEEVTKDLKSQGYGVYRFWESDIYHDLYTVIKIIRDALASSR